MLKRAWLALFVLFMAIGACSSASVTKTSSKERFLALAFWQSDATGFSKVYWNNDSLLVKKSLHIAVEGDAARDYEAELGEVLGLLNQNFQVTLSYGFDPNADVNMLLYYGKEGSNQTAVARENRVNEIVHQRIGAVQYFDTQRKTLSITNQLYQYPISANMDVPGLFDALCETRFYYDDVNLLAKTYWDRTINLTQVSNGTMPLISKPADFSIILGFMGTKPETVVLQGEERWKEMTSLERLEPMAVPCLYEEIVHAVTSWRDLPDAGRTAFTGVYKGSPRRHGQAYMKEIPEVQTMLSYYNLPGMEAGIGYEQARAILGLE